MFLKNPDSFRYENLKIIIPIKNEYTIYQDVNSSLRYLGHEGNKNTELQPIYNDGKSFKLDQKEVSSKFYQYDLEIYEPNKTNKFSFQHQIARHGFHQLMLSL